MTLLQWTALAASLALICLVLGAVIFIAYSRVDRDLERRRRARDQMRHPSQQTRGPWIDEDDL